MMITVNHDVDERAPTNRKPQTTSSLTRCRMKTNDTHRQMNC